MINRLLNLRKDRRQPEFKSVKAIDAHFSKELQRLAIERADAVTKLQERKQQAILDTVKTFS